jgi:hypothetical protein
VLDAWRRQIDGSLERSFPGLARSRLAFCWPIKGEYDARHLAKTLRSRGALTALPVVVAPKTPLAFREWHPGIELAVGPLTFPTRRICRSRTRRGAPSDERLIPGRLLAGLRRGLLRSNSCKSCKAAW